MRGADVGRGRRDAPILTFPLERGKGLVQTAFPLGEGKRPVHTQVAQLQHALLGWYRRRGRDLPWRRSTDPYAILVSEVMLQQTQVERVAPKYVSFLERFPSIEVLAQASRAEVVRAWASLGYNLRAVRLHELAQQVVAQHGGQLPTSVEELLRLKGVGPYTASAVACFAFGQDMAVVDTNVRRVLNRVLAGTGRLSERDMLAQAEALAPTGEAAAWNQGLMDLGATVCLAQRPRCLACPLRDYCKAAPLLQDGQGRVAEARVPYAAKRQTPFKGSSRYYRGRVVEALRALGDGQGMTLKALGGAIKSGFTQQEAPWLMELVQGLQRDGLVRLEPSTEADPAQARVRLA